MNGKVSLQRGIEVADVFRILASSASNRRTVGQGGGSEAEHLLGMHETLGLMHSSENKMKKKKMKIVLDHTGGPNVITRVLKSGRRRQERHQRERSVWHGSEGRGVAGSAVEEGPKPRSQVAEKMEKQGQFPPAGPTVDF